MVSTASSDLGGHRIPTFRLIVALALFLTSGFADAAARPLEWGSLEAGAFAIGFRSEWRLDHSRTYRTNGELGDLYGAVKAPRPVLLNIWYPARPTTGTSMTHGDYFAVAKEVSAVEQLAIALGRYAHDSAATELRHKQPEQFDAQDRAVVEALFATAIPVRRNATEARGRFPLIIYHSGFGSSFEDNAVLCEYLASHGFVVVDSAFLDADGASFNIDGSDGSIGDVRMIALTARSWPNVNWSKIGLVGHSGGAQLALRYEAAGSSLVDAIVSLDTTQDSHSLMAPAWATMTQAILDNLRHMTAPIMLAAPRTAIFQLADRMEGAERYLVTTDHLDHNDYISQGVVARSARADPAAVTETYAVREEYDRLDRTILMFFDAYLKGAADSLAVLRDPQAASGSILPQIEYLPKHSSQTKAYAEGNALPPSPRQLRLVGTQHGFEKVAVILEQFKEARASLPIYEPFFAAVWINELISDGKTDIARYLLHAYRDVDPELARNIEANVMHWANLFVQIKAKAALSWLRTVTVLDPNNREAAAKLDALSRDMPTRR